MNPTTKVVGREFSDDAFNVTSRRGRRSGTGRLGRRRRGADFTGRFSDQKAGNLAVEHVEARTRGSQVASYLAAAGNGPAGQEECSRRTGSIERRALLAPMAVSLKLAYDAPSACDDRQHEQTRQDADGTRAAAPIAADAGVQELASPRAEFNLLNNQHPMPARQQPRCCAARTAAHAAGGLARDWPAVRKMDDQPALRIGRAFAHIPTFGCAAIPRFRIRCASDSPE